jgi:hypothetical protein
VLNIGHDKEISTTGFKVTENNTKQIITALRTNNTLTSFLLSTLLYHTLVSSSVAKEANSYLRDVIR